MCAQARAEALKRKRVQAVREVVGPFKDIPAPDMNTDSRHMVRFTLRRSPECFPSSVFTAHGVTAAYLWRCTRIAPRTTRLCHVEPALVHRAARVQA